MNFKEYYNLQEKKEKRRLDPKCWKGYRKSGTKMKGGTRVNNCVKIKESTDVKFVVEGEMTFINPFGTGRKNFPVAKYVAGKAKTSVSAANENEAAVIAAIRVGKERGFTQIPVFIKNKGYKVYRAVSEQIVTEEYEIKEYKDLPDPELSKPYGFWITKNGKYVVVNHMGGHDEALRALFPNGLKDKDGMAPRGIVALLQSAMENGMIRVVKEGGGYHFTYHPKFLSKDARKAAKDLAINYQMDILDAFGRL